MLASSAPLGVWCGPGGFVKTVREGWVFDDPSQHTLGTGLAMKRSSTTVADDVLESGLECWFAEDGDARGAARSAYQAAVGLDPGPVEVHHHCGTVACVRPTHLVLDCDESRLHALHAISRVGSGTIAARVVEAIRLAHAEGHTERQLARRFGLPRPYVRDLVTRPAGVDVDRRVARQRRWFLPAV